MEVMDKPNHIIHWARRHIWETQLPLQPCSLSSFPSLCVPFGINFPPEVNKLGLYDTSNNTIITKVQRIRSNNKQISSDQ